MICANCFEFCNLSVCPICNIPTPGFIEPYYAIVDWYLEQGVTLSYNSQALPLQTFNCWIVRREHGFELVQLTDMTQYELFKALIVDPWCEAKDMFRLDVMIYVFPEVSLWRLEKCRLTLSSTNLENSIKAIRVQPVIECYGFDLDYLREQAGLSARIRKDLRTEQT